MLRLQYAQCIIIEILNNSMRATLTPTLLLLLLLPLLASSQPCTPNYQYPDPSTNLCLPCPTSCLSCFDSQSCTACVSEYYLSNNQCLQCPFGCAVCSDGLTCSTCVEGLYVNGDGDCVPCAIGVRTCTIAVVESCREGYFMLGSICAGCFDHCSTCQDFVTCSLCDTGYYVGPNSTSCLPCSNNCSVCQDANTCTSCYQGFVLNVGTCVAPSCSSISPFCTKCANGLCEGCTFGKYVNSNGTCSQGASLLCYSASGPYHINCQTNLYGCPAYSQAQTDLLTNTQLPICLPLHATQNNEYLYSPYPSSCSIPAPSACSLPFSKTFTFSTLKSYFSLAYHIAMKVYSTAVQDFTVSYLESGTGNVLAFLVHKVDVTAQLGQNLVDSQCYNCKYGYVIISGELTVTGGDNDTLLEVRSMASFFEVTEILIETGLCKVSRCSACTTAIDCVECHAPYFLQLISCVTECDPGFYKYGRTCVLTCPSDAYPIQSSYQCFKCISPCLTCSSQTQCLSCVDGFFLDGTACLTQCSSPTLFTNITSKTCQICPNPCTQCTVTLNSTNTSSPNPSWSVSCSGCGVGYLLQNGNCTYLCPIGTFANYINNKTQCSSCQIGCTECSISSNICMACSASYLLGGSSCFVNYVCPLGYFVNGSKNSCEKCHFPCLGCVGVGGNCTSCLKGALFNNTCPLQCPARMFVQYSQNSQICSLCASPCVQCISLSVCLSCINSTYLANGQCLPQCPSLTSYPQPTNNTCTPCTPPCLQCKSPTQCLSCTTGHIDLSTYRCTLQCNATSYPDTNFTCQLCTPPCVRCFSGSSCAMCGLPWVLYEGGCVGVIQCESMNRYVHYRINYTDPALGMESGECQQCTYPCASCNNSPIVCKSCVPGYKHVPDLSICVQQCPQSYYPTPNTTTNSTECQKCSSNCLSCTTTPSTCTQCGTSMYLFTNSTCLLACPPLYYGNNEEQVCKLCQLPCLDCFNVYLCRSCAVGIYYNKGCVDHCPVGSIHNVTGNTCEPCTNNCLACSVVTYNCTECPTNGFYFCLNQCLTACPTLFYADDLSHNCEPCIEPCQQCTGATQCKTCVAGYYLLPSSSRCTTVCPEGYYTDNGTLSCQPCNGTICRACSLSANNCTKCSLGYYFSYNSSSCEQTCPPATYPDPLYLECRGCQFPCQACNQTSCFQCLNSYQLYLGNCYASCPIGYFPGANSTCSQCQPICELCTSVSLCVKCVAGYFVNGTGGCVRECQVGFYGGFDLLTSYGVCVSCPVQCVACVQVYNCTLCRPGNVSFNGLCLDQCPALYYPSPQSTCKPCPQFCNKCTNSSSCLQCLNSYKYLNLCYPACPAQTYTQNQQLCIDCSSPCLECTSQYYCLSCLAGYYYFQNYCVRECPADVWRYPETGSCQAECPFNRYAKEMLCFRNGCGGMLVHLNGYCLDQCPNGYYVDQNQNCIECTASASAQQICKKLMVGQLQILRSYNLRACLYLNQLINPQQVPTQRIQISWTNKNTGLQITYEPTKITVQASLIMIEFGYLEMQLYRIEIKIPYIVSTESLQSVSYNFYQADIDVYNDYRYRGEQRLLVEGQGSGSEFNVLYQPSTVMNAVAIVLVAGTLICLVVNLVVKGTHYRQLLDFLQFVAATLYLQIQYPPILQQYLYNLRIALFTMFPQLTTHQPYTFSPSKFIEYHKDSSLLRTQGLPLIFFLTLLLLFSVLILINRFNPHLLKSAIKRIKYRNVTDTFSVFSLPLLVFCFRFAGEVGDAVLGGFVLVGVVGFVGGISYLLMTVRNLQEIAGLAGQLQHTPNPLGHMYTPFSFIRKLIFSLTLAIQPTKPISTLTLLLIFTILIMVCLFFYQPFENQVTDYICIAMEVVLIIYVVVVMMFGLNVVKGVQAHWMGVAAGVVTGVGGGVGLGWLVYLTFGAVNKYRKEQPDPQVANENPLEQNLQSQNPNENQNESLDPNSAMKINHKSGEQANQSHEGQRDSADEDQPSASQLITGYNNKGRDKDRKRGSKASKFSEPFQVDLGESEGGEEFRHWNNSESDNMSQASRANRAPKYLLKMQKNPIQDNQ